MATSAQMKNADIPVEIHGYVTDPRWSGYQIITNYENIYWRAFVGNDAWGLFEVVRSFCHNLDDTCRLSTTLLMAILGLQQQKVLTGLIRTLQNHHLINAKEVESGRREKEYIFKVNLSPGILTEEQVAQLPKSLQEKHVNSMLQRIPNGILHPDLRSAIVN
jgi:hypothetical protein